MQLRRCDRCGDLKPISEFAWRRRDRGRRDNYCSVCRTQYQREHYAQHRDRYLARAVRRKKELTAERADYLITLFRERPCVDCGETDPVLLDFDHRDPDRKAGNIGEFARRGTWTQVSREIEKCDVRCAKCHRRKTAQQFGWAKLAIA